MSPTARSVHNGIMLIVGLFLTITPEMGLFPKILRRRWVDFALNVGILLLIYEVAKHVILSGGPMSPMTPS